MTTQVIPVQKISDVQEEKNLLMGVGFKVIKEAENYALLQREEDFAFLMKGWIIQGKPSYIIEALTGGEPDFPLAFQADLWELLLDLVRSEVI